MFHLGGAIVPLICAWRKTALAAAGGDRQDTTVTRGNMQETVAPGPHEEWGGSIDRIPARSVLVPNVREMTHKNIQVLDCFQNTRNYHRLKFN